MVVNLNDQYGRERWLTINRQIYATTFLGNAPLARTAARPWRRPVAVASASCARSTSTQFCPDACWARRGAESSESCVGAAGRGRGLAPRACDLGPTARRIWGGGALPRTALAGAAAAVAKAAACKLTTAPPKPCGMHRAGEVSNRRPWPKRAIAGWRLPALFGGSERGLSTDEK